MAKKLAVQGVYSLSRPLKVTALPPLRVECSQGQGALGWLCDDCAGLFKNIATVGVVRNL